MKRTQCQSVNHARERTDEPGRSDHQPREKADEPGPSDRQPRQTDPYEDFLAEQRVREAEWASNRAAKKIRLDSTEVGTNTPHVDKEEQREIDSIRQLLNARNKECTALKDQLRDLQQANAVAIRSQQKMQETMSKVSTKVRAQLNSVI